MELSLGERGVWICTTLAVLIAVVFLLLGCAVPEQTRRIGDVEYPVNANGQTYGSSMDAFMSLPEGKVGDDVIDYLPDLVAVTSPDGQEGYVLKEDFLPPAPRTPEEAAAMAKEGSHTVPLYDEDGVTVIGSWQTTGVEVG